MSKHLIRRLIASGVMALSVLGAGGAYAAGNDPDADDAGLRARAQYNWYHEGYGKDVGQGQRGGRALWSPSYRRFFNDAAARERAKWGTKTVTAPDGSRQTVLAGSATVVGSAWVNIGPTRADFMKNGSYNLPKTDAGRVRNIVIDPVNPLRIFLATSGGGVWRTLDGGVTWTSVTETLGSLSVGALAMDPNNSNVLYLGLGDPFDGTGSGLVKSSDGGLTWSAPVYLGASTATTDIAVARTDSNIVLATTDKGVFRSTDAGATWSQVNLGGTAPYGWSIAWTGGSGYAVAFEAAYTTTTGTTDGQVWVTANNGASWTRATGFTKTGGVGRITLASAPSNRQTLYAVAAVPNSSSAADLADLFKSSNGGASWTAMGATKKRYSNGSRESVANTLNAQGWYDQLLTIHPTNPNTFYLGGALYLGRSTDAGGTYSQLTAWLGQYGLPYVHADFHTAAFASDGTFYVGSDGGIFKSTDNGTTWTDTLNVGLTTHLLYSIGSSPANRNAVIGGLQDNGTRVRSGATSTFNQTIGGDGFGAKIHQTNAQTMVGSLYYTQIRRSTDGGNNWASGCTGITECGASTAPFYTKIEAWTGDSTGNTLYTHSNTKAYKSTNFGSSWVALGATGLPNTTANPLYIRNINAAHTDGATVGIVTNAGRVFLSSNSGASWTQAGAVPNHGSSLSFIHFSTADRNTIYISSVAPDATKSHLWKSTDFGASWTAIDGGGFPFGVPVDVVKNDPGSPSTIYAGTHLGVYVSTDGGASWSRFGAGMPLVEVSDIYISSDSTLVRAASYGRGFWELQ